MNHGATIRKTYPPRQLTMLSIYGCDFCPQGYCDKCGQTEKIQEVEGSSPRSDCSEMGESTTGRSRYSVGSNNNIERIGDIHIFGWQYCKCCKSQLQSAKRFHTLDIPVILKIIGSSFKVQRTSGQIDEGKWSLWYCLRTDTSTISCDLSSHMVWMKGVHEDTRDYTKTATLSDLLRWNGHTLSDVV